MNEQSFIREMQSALGGLSHDQREEILAEYRSHFFEGKERGKTEEEISRALGEPRSVARAYLADYHFQAFRSPAPGQSMGTSVAHLVRALFVAFTLMFFNFFLLPIPVLMFVMLLSGLWLFLGVAVVAGLAFFLVAIVGGSSSVPLDSFSAQMALIFYALAVLSGGSLGIVALFYVTRGSIRALMKYIRLNINIAERSVRP